MPEDHLKEAREQYDIACELLDQDGRCTINDRFTMAHTQALIGIGEELRKLNNRMGKLVHHGSWLRVWITR